MQLRGGPVLREDGRAVGIHEPIELGPRQDLAVYTVDTTIARRPATAADLARLEPPPTARPVRPGPAMHLVRPSTNPRSWRNYRSALGSVEPVTPLEDTVTTPAAPPFAVPCAGCLHATVCGIRDKIPEAPATPLVMELADGLRIMSTAFAIECDHRLTTDVERHPIPQSAERMQASRQRGAAANAERIAKERPSTVETTGRPKRGPMSPEHRAAIAAGQLRARLARQAATS
jgi:hypothetical protein